MYSTTLHYYETRAVNLNIAKANVVIILFLVSHGTVL